MDDNNGDDSGGWQKTLMIVIATTIVMGVINTIAVVATMVGRETRKTKYR